LSTCADAQNWSKWENADKQTVKGGGGREVGRQVRSAHKSQNYGVGFSIRTPEEGTEELSCGQRAKGGGPCIIGKLEACYFTSLTQKGRKEKK